MPLRPPAGFISAFYDPLKVADAPTIGTATGGDASASVAFTAPTNTGGAAITQYYAVSNPSQITGNAASSPVTVSGLTNGTSYTFTVWALNSYGPSPYSAASGSVTPALARGLFGGGDSSSNANIIDYINIASTGNAADFGDLTTPNESPSSCASSTRGIWGGGKRKDFDATIAAINYITIATTGNATSFGDLINSVYRLGAASNSTRGLFIGGVNNSSSTVNVIQYITISSTGNATDFGDVIGGSGASQMGACASTTRAVFATDQTSGSTIQYITIDTLGNSVNFGNLSQSRNTFCGFSSSTRGVFTGGTTGGGTEVNTIDYITIASTGNATDFGDLILAVQGSGGCSSSTRGVSGGGLDPTTTTNVIQYVTIASTGNATDFGDLITARWTLAACSSNHGGL